MILLVNNLKEKLNHDLYRVKKMIN